MSVLDSTFHIAQSHNLSTSLGGRSGLHIHVHNFLVSQPPSLPQKCSPQRLYWKSRKESTAFKTPRDENSVLAAAALTAVACTSDHSTDQRGTPLRSDKENTRTASGLFCPFECSIDQAQSGVKRFEDLDNREPPPESIVSHNKK